MTADDWVELINQEYFFLVEGGHSIVKECYNDELKSHDLEYISKDRFKLRWDIHSGAIKKTEKPEEGN